MVERSESRALFLESGGESVDRLILDLSDRLETLIFLLETLDEFVRHSPYILESLNKEIIRFREMFSSKESKEFLNTLGTVLELLGKEETYKIIQSVGSAYVETKENDYRTSITGLVRALADPDIQRSLAFILLTLKKVGEVMGNSQNR